MDVTADPVPEVDLAAVPDFDVGRMRICPSACRVRADGREQKLEPRVMQVLVLLAQRRDQTITRDQLVEACWDGRIVSDDAINRVIAQVRALIRSFDPPPFSLVTVPKVGFRLSEPTIPGETATANAARRRPPWIAAAAGLAVLAAVAILLVWRVGADPGQSGRVEVIAFEARADDPELRRLSAEAADSLIRVLSQSGIDTLPHVGALDVGGPSEAELRIAGALGRSGGEVVLDHQVLDRRSGRVLLAVQTRRPAGEAAALLEQGAVGLAGALDCALEDRRQSGGQLEPEVLSLLLNTCDALVREGNYRRMLDSGRRLVAAAPDLAVAHGLYATAQAGAAMTLESRPDVARLREGAQASAARALALDPNTARAHQALSLSYPRGGHWLERERHLLRARSLDPRGNLGRSEYNALLGEVGRLKEALESANRLLDSGDPQVLASALRQVAFLHLQMGNQAGFRQSLARLEQHDPSTAREFRLTAALWFSDDPTAGLREMNRYRSANINDQAQVCAEVNAARQAQAGGAPLVGLPPECASISPERRIRMLTRQGDIDGAYAVYATHAGELSHLRGFPQLLFYRQMKPFRDDGRFMPLVHRLGLVDYWRTSGRWPDFCAEPDLPYDCRAEAEKLAAAKP